MLSRQMTRQKQNWLTSKWRSRPIWKERNKKSGTDCELPVLTTRTPLPSSMHWLVTPRHCSRLRRPLSSSSEVRSRRIHSYSLHGCSFPTCLRHPFPSFHSHFSPWRARDSSRSLSQLCFCCYLVWGGAS